MTKKKLLSVVLFLLCVGVSYAEPYLVTALNEVPSMNPDFWMTGHELMLENNTPYINIEFTGNCVEKVVNQCDVKKHEDHYDFEPLSSHHHHGPSDCKGHYHSFANRHSAYDSCRFEKKLICEHQEGKYRLPPERVIYDGDKRWKFLGDEAHKQYLTIARNDRSGLTRKWKLRSYVELSVAPNGYQSLTLTIHLPAE